MERVYVYAAGYNEYCSFLHINRLDRREYVYITMVSQLEGITPLKIIRFGNWWEKHDSGHFTDYLTRRPDVELIELFEGKLIPLI